MNKNTAIGSLLAILVVCITVLCINFCEKENSSNSKIVMPKANEKMWTYDMTKKNWHKYKPLDEDNLKEYVILQFDDMTSDGGYCAYHLQTTNVQVPKELFVVGESSQEFLKNGHLYSYFPKNFEFYEIKFNGVKFIPQKMTSKDIQKLIPDINIIKVSALKKEKNYTTNKSSKFIIINDIGEKFYKYYIVPNESKKLQIGDFSNQFEIKKSVKIQLQRLEGCSKTYPCYSINIKKD